MTKIKDKEKQFKRASVKAFEKMKIKEVNNRSECSDIVEDWEKNGLFDFIFDIAVYYYKNKLNHNSLKAISMARKDVKSFESFIRSLLKAHTSRIVGIVEELKGKSIKVGNDVWIHPIREQALDDILKAIRK